MPDICRMSFGCLVKAGEMESQALLLASSVRQFGGRYAYSPMTLYCPTGISSISPSALAAFDQLDLELRQIDAPPATQAFPFASKVLAAAEAERFAQDNSELLVWMDTDSIIINEPLALSLPGDKVVGYRPVDHTLIGSRYHQPVDPFWQLIYDKCMVPEEHLFPMATSVDQVTIRPYFNAGMLVVRPERGLLRKWADAFCLLFRLPEFTPFYEENPVYKIFVHQAVLAGIILASLEGEELHELPRLVNYPLHMHAEYPADYKPTTMNEIITCRYDPGFSQLDLQELIEIEAPLKNWLDQQLAKRKKREDHD